MHDQAKVMQSVRIKWLVSIGFCYTRPSNFIQSSKMVAPAFAASFDQLVTNYQLFFNLFYWLKSQKNLKMEKNPVFLDFDRVAPFKNTRYIHNLFLMIKITLVRMYFMTQVCWSENPRISLY